MKPFRVVSATLFSPRGGSAFVARALARCLRAEGVEITHVSGSRSDLEGDAGDARVFYGDLGVRAVDFAAALASDDPMAFAGGPGEAPLHPSFEDRPGQPDRVFAALDDLACHRQVARVGARARGRRRGRRRRPAPAPPHAAERGRREGGAGRSGRRAPARHRAADARGDRRRRGLAARGGVGRAAARLGRRVRAADPRARELERAAELLGVPAERCIAVPNGFDPRRSSAAVRSTATPSGSARRARRCVPPAAATPAGRSSTSGASPR